MSAEGGETSMFKRKILMTVIAVHTMAALAVPTAGQSALVNGRVTKIDEAAGKITIKHSAIKKLDMEEGMTMVFRARDPAMLKQVKAGDKIRFDADRINGQITVTKIEKAK